jgi:hypothetical protein
MSISSKNHGFGDPTFSSTLSGRAALGLALLAICAASTLASADDELESIEILSIPAFVGEGDSLSIVLNRTMPDRPALRLIGRVAGPAPQDDTPTAFVEWDAGETGERTLAVPVVDDTAARGDGQRAVKLTLAFGDALVAMPDATVMVLDNDRDDRAVLRSRNGENGFVPFLGSDQGTPLAVVLDGGAAYELAAGTGVNGDVHVYGNGAVLQPLVDDSEALLRVVEGGQLTLDRVRIHAPEIGIPQALLRAEGDLVVQRSVIETLVPDVPQTGRLFIGPGRTVLRRSVVRGTRSTQAFYGGALDMDSSTIMEARSFIGFVRAGRPSTFRWNSVVRNSSTPVLDGEAEGQIRAQGNLIALTFGGPLADPPPPLCWGNVLSEGFNYRSATCAAFNAGTDAQFPTEGLLGSPIPVEAPNDWYLPGVAATDVGDGCPEVDQRGMPRPQSLVADTEPRCEIGAIELGINPYRGAWIPERAGHGVDLQTAGNRLLLAWYTYASDGQPTAYQAAAPLTGPTWRASLQQARRDPTSGEIAIDTVGEIGIDFDSNTEATLRWQFGDEPAGSERISAYVFAQDEPRFEVTGLWFPPAESGNGASVVRRGEITAVAIYYYDDAGNLRWALGTGDAGDVVEVELLSYTGFCPNCDAAEMPVQNVQAGRGVIHFLTPDRARVDTDITYPGPIGGQWQRVRADFVPINDLVANEHTLVSE